MKFLVFFVLCFVALATAAPQYFGWPGYFGTAPATRTLVAGPTVVNGGYGYNGYGYGGWGGRYVTPGFVGTF